MPPNPPPVVAPDPTLTVARCDGGDPLVIPNARRVAEAFFAIDASSRQPVNEGTTAPYDEWSASPNNQANRIEAYDVHVLNSSMRARTKAGWWTAHTADDELDWLLQVDPAWDLLEYSEEQWEACDGEAAVERLMLGIMRKGISVSVGTKMLHLKRPRLVPVLDDLVVQQLGGHVSSQAKYETRAHQMRELVAHVREQGRVEANHNALSEIRDYLATPVIGQPRTLVRIFDALLWSSHPSSLIAPMQDLLARWDVEEEA